MSTTATGISPDEVVEKLMRRVSKDQLKKLIEVAGAVSGQVVANEGFEPGDELCPVFRFPFPCPPRFDQFLNEAAALGHIRLFPHGIIAPDTINVQVGIRNIA
jgi:hypothetical protein